MKYVFILIVAIIYLPGCASTAANDGAQCRDASDYAARAAHLMVAGVSNARVAELTAPVTPLQVAAVDYALRLRHSPNYTMNRAYLSCRANDWSVTSAEADRLEHASD